MLITVGSIAARRRGINVKRKTTDHDMFSTEPLDSIEVPREIDGLRVDAHYHPLLAEWTWGDDSDRSTATLNELYTIKLSHSYWALKNKSWHKHVFDMAMLKRAGAVLIPELHDLLYKIWEEQHGKKLANLEQDPSEFFNPSVHRVYEHDSLHASVAYFDGVPLFNKILRDGHQVAVDVNKFNALSQDMKLKLVREEVYATALERRLIPEDFKVSQNDAYQYALHRTIVSYSKGWFPKYILDNYEELRTPAEDFVKIFNENQDRLVKL